MKRIFMNEDVIIPFIIIIAIIISIFIFIKWNKECEKRGGKLVRGYCISSEVIK